MSSAFYPLGMKSYNNHLPQGGYKSWKGDGVFSNPVGITAGTIRPLTNKDYTNNFPTGFGLPRPIKHARKGRGFRYNIVVYDPNNISNYRTYSVNRCNRSSTFGTMVKQMIDIPGGYSVSQNTPDEVSNTSKLDNECRTCRGIGIVSSYYPNTLYLTENPERNTQNAVLCCNAEKKALRRVIYANTNFQPILNNVCCMYQEPVPPPPAPQFNY